MSSAEKNPRKRCFVYPQVSTCAKNVQKSMLKHMPGPSCGIEKLPETCQILKDHVNPIKTCQHGQRLTGNQMFCRHSKRMQRIKKDRVSNKCPKRIRQRHWDISSSVAKFCSNTINRPQIVSKSNQNMMEVTEEPLWQQSVELDDKLSDCCKGSEGTKVSQTLATAIRLTIQLSAA